MQSKSAGSFSDVPFPNRTAFPTWTAAVAERCVSRSSDSLLAKSALDAASPFPPMPRLARCIAGAEIVRHVYSAEH
jgi:hypothetical protein